MAFGNVILGASLSAIISIISLLIYLAIYTALNLEQLTAGQTSMLGVIPTVLVASTVISVLVLGFGLVLGRK